MMICDKDKFDSKPKNVSMLPGTTSSATLNNTMKTQQNNSGNGNEPPIGERIVRLETRLDGIDNSIKDLKTEIRGISNRLWAICFMIVGSVALPYILPHKSTPIEVVIPHYAEHAVPSK